MSKRSIRDREKVDRERYVSMKKLDNLQNKTNVKAMHTIVSGTDVKPHDINDKRVNREKFEQKNQAFKKGENTPEARKYDRENSYRRSSLAKQKAKEKAKNEACFTSYTTEACFDAALDAIYDVELK